MYTIGLGNLIWIDTGPLRTGSLGADGAFPAAQLGGPAGAAVGHAGNAVEDRGAARGHPADSGASDPAWMPPLAKLPDRAFQYQIELYVDQETGHVVARVIDRESGEVVRQVPPEHVLQLAIYIDDWLGRVLDAWA